MRSSRIASIVLGTISRNRRAISAWPSAGSTSSTCSCPLTDVGLVVLRDQGWKDQDVLLHAHQTTVIVGVPTPRLWWPGAGDLQMEILCRSQAGKMALPINSLLAIHPRHKADVSALRGPGRMQVKRARRHRLIIQEQAHL